MEPTGALLWRFKQTVIYGDLAETCLIDSTMTRVLGETLPSSPSPPLVLLLSPAAALAPLLLKDLWSLD